MLTRTENLNKSVFSSFLILRVNKNTIEEHICHVSAEGIGQHKLKLLQLLQHLKFQFISVNQVAVVVMIVTSTFGT